MTGEVLRENPIRDIQSVELLFQIEIRLVLIEIVKKFEPSRAVSSRLVSRKTRDDSIRLGRDEAK